MPRRRGNGWSKVGTKASRRLHRLHRRGKWYYAVAVGRRPGIYEDWNNAKPQILNYSGAVFKKFHKLEEAQHFMNEERISPPGVRTPFPPCRDTPMPPPHLNPEYETEFPDYVRTRQTKHVDVQMQMTPYIQVTPVGTPDKEFRRLQLMSQRIVNDTSNLVLDPPSFECTAPDCNFCMGDFWGQRFALLKRLYQLNAQLGGVSAPPAEQYAQSNGTNHSG